MTTSQSVAHTDRSQFGLLKTRRFAPFFGTQFFGAFNDNVFKNALMVFLAFQAVHAAVSTSVLMNLAAGLFILPFFLFSATAGQIADRQEKSSLIRIVKAVEIGIMALVPVAFYLKSTWMLLGLLFLMGTQSAFFGPVKYSLMPQHLAPGEIVGGNAMVEMGTFLAILGGTIAGGLLIQLDNATLWVGATVVSVAVAGWLTSRQIPEAAPSAPGLKVNWNPVTETWRTLRLARRVPSVFLSILGISWFWFLGAAYLTQLPAYTRDILGGNEQVVTLLLAVFSIGIGFGSLLCERLSGKQVELGLVPLGALGLSVFGIDLYLARPVAAGAADLSGMAGFVGAPGSLRVLMDLALIGVFGGFYIVPLFAFIQTRTRPEERSRIIAANNIMNACLMVGAALAGMLLLGFVHLSIPQFFLVIAIANIGVAAYIFAKVPAFVARFLVWILTHTVYRVHHNGLERIPETGAAVVVCNHVSYMDGLVIAGSLRRPVRFLVYEPIYRLPVLHAFFKMARAIPICSPRQNPEVVARAFAEVDAALKNGEVVGIFPEGQLSRDGRIGTFKSGIERIIKTNPVPVVPMALIGLWGSFFSHKNGPAMTRPFRRFWSRIHLVAGEPVPASAVTASALRQQVERLTLSGAPA